MARAEAITQLDAVIAGRFRAASGGSDGSGDRGYTRRLAADRNLRLKKLGEESAELAVACADQDRDRAVSEAGDLFYHMLVALHALGAGLPDLQAELARRARSDVAERA